MDDADRTAVRDDKNLLARVLAQHLGEEVVHAGREIREGLRVIRPRALACEPAPVRVAESLLDLRGRQSFPGTEASFSQPRIDPDLEAQLRSDDVCGLSCAGQI